MNKVMLKIFILFCGGVLNEINQECNLNKTEGVCLCVFVQIKQ